MLDSTGQTATGFIIKHIYSLWGRESAGAFLQQWGGITLDRSQYISTLFKLIYYNFVVTIIIIIWKKKSKLFRFKILSVTFFFQFQKVFSNKKIFWTSFMATIYLHRLSFKCVRSNSLPERNCLRFKVKAGNVLEMNKRNILFHHYDKTTYCLFKVPYWWCITISLVYLWSFSLSRLLKM